MYSLNLPEVKLKFRREGDLLRVFDPIRGKYVAFTPEENVRQHFTAWLINGLHYPAALMQNEVELSLNGTKRRCDTLVRNSNGQPLMLIEYKAPEVPITQDVFDQIVRYNMVIRARYLVVSNGLQHYCCVINYNDGSYNFIPSIPDWQHLITAIHEN